MPSNLTPFVINLQRAVSRAEKAVQGIAFNDDQKQYALACVELGRLREIAQGILDLCIALEPMIHNDEPR